MAKVSLRIYNREIESLIDQGRNAEAIAHCHHILRTFPKHLATYRLLGKAHLELKRYAEAVDVFSRVLMAAPDDFVAHVGMGIIRDEERKMDDAIWHMERAFETQPSNGAIQGELQRLYGRRDGMEPPKIRMTRGALSHMYVQGELYPQAIAEIRAVLAQEPERTDMQVLLARAYFRGGQKADASDMCAQLLKRYPYCFDANRIMVDLLPSTAGVAESTQVYRMRVGEMDPYATFAKGSVFLAHEVADAAINLERLEYKEENEPAGAAWTPSLGLGSGAATAAPALAAATPVGELEWLKTDTSSQQSVTAASEQADEIPDFLRQAGWGASTSTEQPTSIFDEDLNNTLTPAEIPDWLKGQEPVASTPTPAPSRPEPAPTMEVPDWLQDNSQASGSAQAGNIPDWLQDTSQVSTESASIDHTAAWLSELDDKKAAKPAQAESNVPDWLSGLDDKQTAKPAQAESNVPDWLSELDDKKPALTESNAPDWLSGLDDKQATESAQAESNAPDWLSGLADKQTAEPTLTESNVPDWLSGLDDKQTAEPALTESNVPDWLSGLDDKQTAEPALTESNVPDWLSGLDAQNEKPAPTTSAIEGLGATAQEQDDAVAWLESLAAKHGAKPEELVTDPSKRSEKPPEWVSQAQNLNQETPAPKAPAASVESLGASAQEQDDAVAWLESLAAKHGAKPEELVTDPNKRSDTPPEWVSQAQNLNQEAPAAASVESLGATAQEQDDAVAWLESLAAKHGAKPEELVTDPSKRSDTPPEWVSQAQTIGESQSEQKPEVVENALNIGEQFFAEFESASTAPPMDATSAWLKSLDEEDEKQAQSVESSKGVPEWFDEAKSEPESLQRSEIPEWLSDAQSQEAEAQTSDLPNWLSDTESDVAPEDEVRQDVPETDLANWLNSLDDEPGLPFDSVPTPDSILFASQARPKADEPVKKEIEQPDWLSDGDSESAEEVRLQEGIPDWLKEVDEETDFADTDSDLPPWQHRERWEAEEPQHPTPTTPSDWHPLEPKKVEAKPIPRQEAPVEAHKPFVPPPPQPSADQPFAAPIPQSAATAKKKAGLPVRKQPEGANAVVALNQAKGELDRGDIPAALAHYGKLIKRGKHIEETIRDLTESIYRYPVEVGIWQALGDAYMRANRLKEALEAYNKAEELIR